MAEKVAEHRKKDDELYNIMDFTIGHRDIVFLLCAIFLSHDVQLKLIEHSRVIIFYHHLRNHATKETCN